MELFEESVRVYLVGTMRGVWAWGGHRWAEEEEDGDEEGENEKDYKIGYGEN